MKKIVILLTILLAVNFIFAETLVVDCDGTGQFREIQEAINVATNGDIIKVYPGLYVENISFLGKSLSLKSLRSYEEDDSYIEQTIIRGEDGSYRIIFLNTTDRRALIDGFTLENSSGDAITVLDVERAKIQFCNFKSNLIGIKVRNIGDHDPIIYPDINNCKFIDNRLGIRVEDDTAPYIRKNMFSNNMIGIFAWGINTDNEVRQAYPSVSQNLFIENKTGLSLEFVTFEFFHNTFYKNETCIKNGLTGSVTGEYNNSIFYENEKVIKFGDYAFETKLLNCIVWNNSVVLSSLTDLTYSIYDRDFSGTGNIKIAPSFEDPGNIIEFPKTYGFGLKAGSPAIDNGDPNSPNDPDGSRADIGAFWFQDRNYDIKNFHAGWNWQSFPRLQEQFQNPETNYWSQNAVWGDEDNLPLLRDINTNRPTIDDFEKLRDQFKNYIFYHEQFNNWTSNGGRNKLYRNVGYKEKLKDDSNGCNFLVYGERRDFQYEYDLLEMSTKWLPYGITRNQNIQDAFGDNWNNVYSVKAEDWYYWCGQNPRREDGQIPWSSIMSPKGKTMVYGMTYEVIMKNDVNNFKWSNSGLNSLVVKKEIPQNFTYNTKATYEAIDIVSVENPDEVVEIGVFQNGKCVGASVVDEFPVQILAYTSQVNRDGETLSFEVITGRNKIRHKNYEILNPSDGNFHNHALLGAHQNHSIIRLNNKGENDAVELNTIIDLQKNFPNPFMIGKNSRSQGTTISFSINKESAVNLSIYNIKGQKVKTLVDGVVKKGIHNIEWSGENNDKKKVASGVYFYKLKSNNESKIEKILILN